jgi:hypothetical protein
MDMYLYGISLSGKQGIVCIIGLKYCHIPGTNDEKSCKTANNIPEVL